jgi:hypothetical protein
VFILLILIASFGTPTKLATIKSPSVNESSGLVASHSTPGVYWTHNDSGDGPFLYAFDATGESRGVFRVSGAQARDWEDMSIGPGPNRASSYLYIGDIGDNEEARAEIVVYRVAEPAITAADKTSTKKQPRTTVAAEAIRLRYPDGKHDAESLLVHPVTGNLYIVSKALLRQPVVYEAAAPLTTGSVITMTKIGELQVPSLLGGALTGASISRDGRHVAFCDYLQGYELTLPASSKSFNDIWKQKMDSFPLGQRDQGEAIAYRADGNALLATSEGKSPPLLQVERLRSRSQ